jgi:hypothetical protein
LNNNQQILEEVAQVSDSLEASDEYGISDQMAEELAFKTIELKTDVELAAVGAPAGVRQVGAIGGASTARAMKCLQVQLDDSVKVVAGGGTPPTSLTEVDVLACHEKIRVKGGGKDLFLVHSIAAALDVAQFVSSVAGETAGNRRDIGLGTTLVNAVEMYKTPWGTLTCVVDDFIDPESAILLDPDYVAMKYLQPFHSKPLAEAGFYTKRGLQVECCIAALNTFASGYIDEIHTTVV